LIANRPFEREEKFKSLGTTLTDQSCIHEEVKSRLNAGNAWSLTLREVHRLRVFDNRVLRRILDLTGMR
jgi:hypothetical protein